MKFYTLGYASHKPEDLKKLLDQTPNSIVVDIRFEARSAMGFWCAGPLKKSLEGRYLQVPWLGNMNYHLQAGEIRIWRLEQGLDTVIGLGFENIFLMCACQYEHGCHRQVVAEALRQRGYTVEEATWPNAPRKALSIQQPWAWLIAAGIKNIENRDWHTNFRGEFWIHAGKRFDSDNLKILRRENPNIEFPSEYQMGGVIGAAKIVDCVTKGHRLARQNYWFKGYYGFVIQEARFVPFEPVMGRLNFFSLPELAIVA